MDATWKACNIVCVCVQELAMEMFKSAIAIMEEPERGCGIKMI